MTFVPSIVAFVPGILVNHSNHKAHWAAVSQYKRGWRERVTAAVVTATHSKGWSTSEAWAKVPKRIVFRANVVKFFDSDGLQTALKPVRDALIPLRVIHTDADEGGHEFVYEQRLDKGRGVTIEVTER